MADTELLLDDPDQEQQDDSGDADTEPGDPLEGREDLQKQLYDLYVACCEEDRYPRLVEVMDAQQAHMYWRGLQYIWWSRQDECWNLPNQQHGLQVVPGSIDDMPRFEFVTNIYQGFGLSLIAAIGQAPPRTRWFPDDAEDPDDVLTAEGYTKLSKIIERWNPIQTQMQDEVFHLFTSGVVAGWTRYVADERFGYDETEEMDEESLGGQEEVRCANCGFTAPAGELNGSFPQPCPQCGQPLTEDNIAPEPSGTVPTSKGASQTPKGRQIISVIGALNFKRPQYVRNQSEYHYCAYEEEVHYCKLRAAYPDIADKIRPGVGIGEDNGFERNARMTVMQGTDLSQQTGEAQSVLTTFARVWFRKEAFFHDKVKKEFRQELLDLFPSGCKVYFAGTQYCESEDQGMDDCWAVAHAMPGDGQHRNGLGSSMIPVQDRYNTWSNIQAETYEYGLPITYRAADTWDSTAEPEQRSEPGSVVDVILDKQADIRQRIMQIRGDSVSPDMMEAMANLMGPVSQFLTGAFPALLGAGAAQGAAGDTASGYKMQMDQALGRCGISYVRLKQFHADLQTLSCKDYCGKSSGKARMSVEAPSGGFENEAIDIDALEGDARAYPEGDENFPELWNMQRATFMQIMDSAQGQALLTDPDNQDLAIKLIGIPDLKNPASNMKRYAMRIIGQLIEKASQLDGAQMSPPIPPATRQLEDHGLLAGIGKNWLFSETGLKCMKENPTGYANVEAWTLAQAAGVPPPPPPEKPLSKTLTMAIDKLPPEAQAQIIAKEYGVQLSPEDFIVQAVMDKLKKSSAPTQAPASLPVTGNLPQTGAGVTNA